jgi:hypothetical protein
LALGHGRKVFRPAPSDAHPDFTKQLAKTYLTQMGVGIRPYDSSSTAFEVPDGGNQDGEDDFVSDAHGMSMTSPVNDADYLQEDDDEVSASNETPGTMAELRSTENIVILAAMSRITEGDIPGGRSLLVRSLSYSSANGPVHRLWAAVEDSVRHGNSLGYVELRTDTENHLLKVDGELLDTTLPCGAIVGQGQHLFQIYTNTGENYRFFVNVRGFAKTIIDLDIAHKQYHISGGGNQYYASRSVILSAIDENNRHRNFELPISPEDLLALGPSRRRLYIGVSAPEGADVKWELSWDGIHFTQYEGSTYMQVNDPPKRSCFIRVRCAWGGGECWVTTGYGVYPTPHDLYG